MNDILQWFKGLFDGLINFVLDLVSYLLQWIMSLPLLILEQVLDALKALIGAIPAPDFLQGGLQATINGLDPGIQYLLAGSGFAEGMAILAAGVLFRLTRKLVTLGQW